MSEQPWSPPRRKYPRHGSVRVCGDCGSVQWYKQYSEGLYPPLGHWKPVRWWQVWYKDKARQGLVYVDGQYYAEGESRHGR